METEQVQNQPQEPVQAQPQPQMQPQQPQVKKQKSSLAVIIILVILTISGIGFSIFELTQNMSLQSDKEKLEQKISSLEAKIKEEPETPSVADDVLEYEHYDGFEPGANYNVKINYTTKELHIEVTNFCSAVDCPARTSEYSTTLTDTEIEKVKKITSKKDYDMNSLSSALESIAQDTEVMYPNRYGTYEAEYDLDKDGKVTRREFGDVFLDSILVSPTTH